MGAVVSLQENMCTTTIKVFISFDSLTPSAALSLKWTLLGMVLSRSRSICLLYLSTDAEVAALDRSHWK